MAKEAVIRYEEHQEVAEELFLSKARRALRSTGIALAKDNGPQFQKLSRPPRSKSSKYRHEWRWTELLGRWQCLFCKKTITRKGVQSHRRYGYCHRQHIPDEILDKGHDIHLYGEEGLEGTIMVCQLCGHCGQMRWPGLLQPCKEQRSKQKGTLKWFAQGKHPKPPHISIIRICRARNFTKVKAGYDAEKGKGKGKALDGGLALQGNLPEKGKEEQQLNTLGELEREAARVQQQRDEPEVLEKEMEYEEEEVFSSPSPTSSAFLSGVGSRTKGFSLSFEACPRQKRGKSSVAGTLYYLGTDEAHGLCRALYWQHGAVFIAEYPPTKRLS